MFDLGLLSYYLDIEVRQGPSRIDISQTAYTQKLLEKAGMAGSNSCHVPMEPRFKLSKNSTAPPMDAAMYRSIVGSLWYLVHSRPDLTFAVEFVSRFMEEPTQEHLATVKVRSGRVCTKYRRLPTMLRYSVASVGAAVLFFDSLNRGSMGTWQGLDPAIPAFSSSFWA